MNHSDRCKNVIRTLLGQMGRATYPALALRGGEGLASPLMEMVQAGEVVRHETVRDGVTVREYGLTQGDQA